MTLAKGFIVSYLASTFSETTINRLEIPQDQLNIENKTRSNPLKWNGQFSPQLVDTLLNTYANTGDVIFDPFLGSGTTLLEAGKRGLSAMGTEINPAACALARLYHLINLPVHTRTRLLTELETLLDDRFPLILFQSETVHDGEYVKAQFSKILNAVDSALERDVIAALIVLLDPGRNDLQANHVFKMWRKIADLIDHLPGSEKPIRVFHADARQTPLADQTVDMVLTSPPYINVFNYHQQYRASMEFLHWDLLKVAKSEIGANRKHRGNRFLTVIQYCLDIAQCFSELQRICKPGARVIFVVGRLSTVRGTPFFNGEIVSEIAERAFGNPLDVRQERVYRNRFGQAIYEDILHFSIKAMQPEPEKQCLYLARGVAQDIMTAALPTTPKESRQDLEQAVASISTVQPSPLFLADQAGEQIHEIDPTYDTRR